MGNAPRDQGHHHRHYDRRKGCRLGRRELAPSGTDTVTPALPRKGNPANCRLSCYGNPPSRGSCLKSSDNRRSLCPIYPAHWPPRAWRGVCRCDGREILPPSGRQNDSFEARLFAKMGLSGSGLEHLDVRPQVAPFRRALERVTDAYEQRFGQVLAHELDA